LAEILLIEDDARLGALIVQLLESAGYVVAWETRGQSGLARLNAQLPDLVLLDLGLPDMDGIAVCQRCRQRFTGPIIMLTARDDPIDEIVGLEVGADDYVTKPMNPRVLLARIRARLRRPVQPRSEQGLHIDTARREARVDGELVELTTAEFDLLTYLADRRGQVVERAALYRDLRGIEYDGLDRSIDLRIARLRRLIGDDPHTPRYIKTVRGVGYLLMAPL
jgi:two-component system response regulator RstA